MDEDGRKKAERRAFLEQCGRFAVVTPPVVTLMLSVSDKSASAQLITSRANRTTTTTTTTITTTTIITITPVPSPTLGLQLDGSPEADPIQRADMIDSMALMKIT